jgi:hypothetical protein
MISIGSIARLLAPNNRLEIPAHAQEQVRQAIASISTLITVQSDIGGGEAAEEVPGGCDAHESICCLPGKGLKVSLLAHPFPEGGSYYRPGEGGQTVIAEVEGKAAANPTGSQGGKGSVPRRSKPNALS